MSPALSLLLSLAGCILLQGKSSSRAAMAGCGVTLAVVGVEAWGQLSELQKVPAGRSAPRGLQGVYIRVSVPLAGLGAPGCERVRSGFLRRCLSPAGSPLPRDTVASTGRDAGGSELPRLPAVEGRPWLARQCHVRGGVEESVGGEEEMGVGHPLTPWQRAAGDPGQPEGYPLAAGITEGQKSGAGRKQRGRGWQRVSSGLCPVGVYAPLKMEPPQPVWATRSLSWSPSQ